MASDRPVLCAACQMLIDRVTDRLLPFEWHSLVGGTLYDQHGRAVCIVSQINTSRDAIDLGNGTVSAGLISITIEARGIVDERTTR